MAKTDKKLKLRLKRKKRIRKKVSGTADRLRLTIHKSSRHIYAQVIDDSISETVLSISSFGQKKNATKEMCAELGKKLGKDCKDKKIERLVFDTNGYKYHGRLRAFADGVRESGLNF